MPENRPRRKAVIVGINKYENKEKQKNKFTELEGAENDARDIEAILKDGENPELNYETQCFIGSMATCAAIRKALSDVFWNNEEPCDIALFYFSGHGKEDNLYGEGYIAPYDMLYDAPFVYGIKMSELRDVISKSPHKCTITILDCCYSGIAMKNKGNFDVMPKVNEYIQNFASDGRIILASSREDQKSREIIEEHEIIFRDENEKIAHPHGAFTYCLIEGINCGKTTLSELKYYVTEKMKALSEKTNDPKKQQCCFMASGSGDLENVVIARSHEDKNKKNIQKKIENVKEFIALGKIQLLISAVGHIHDVLKIHSRNQEAFEVKGSIINILEELNIKVSYWISENTCDSSPVVLANFSILERLAHLVTFNGILSIYTNKREKTLLTNLCRVSVGEIDLNEFDGKIMEYISPCSPLRKKETLQVPEKLTTLIQTMDTPCDNPESAGKMGDFYD